MNNQDLKPCPWCGGEAAIVTVRKESYGYYPEAIGAVCAKCGTGRKSFDVTEWKQGVGNYDVRDIATAKAAEAWNTRAPIEVKPLVLVDSFNELQKHLNNCISELERKEARMPHRKRVAYLAKKALKAWNTRAPIEVKPLAEWNEEYGEVVWWKFPVEEPAWIGSPIATDGPDYHTHWTAHPLIPEEPAHHNAIIRGALV